MGEEGVDLAPIPFDAQGRPRLDLVMRGIDTDDPSVVSALDRCSIHLITGALSLTGSPVIEDGVLAALDDFAACMRVRGVPAFPDVVRGFNGVGSPFPVEEIPYDDPDLGPAARVCFGRLDPA
jgi:hypothetical protein